MMEAEIILLIFGVILIAITSLIAFIDAREFKIPDGLTFCLLFAGLCYWLIKDIDKLLIQIIFATMVFFGFWLLRHTHAKITGRLGLGFGDVKFAGAAATWITPFAFPFFLFLASVTGIIYAVLLAYKRQSAIQNLAVPFGLFLSFALVITWFLESLI